MRRTLSFIAVSLAICLTMAAESARVGILNGPSCVPVAQMMNKKGDFEYTQFAEAQALLPKLLKNEVDIGFLPANVAAKVYNASSKAIVLCAVTGSGNIKLITTDQSVKDLSDLSGKTVYVAGQGATPDYLMRYLLAQNSVNAELAFSVPTAQLAAQLISNKIQYAVVPEPFATVAKLKSDSVKVAVDLQEEYSLLNGYDAKIPLTVLVARRDFVEKNPVALEDFLKKYKKSYEWTVKHPAQAGNLCEKHNLGLAAEVITNAIPVSNYVFIPAKDAQKNVEEFLTILLDYSTESIGGKLPEADFYYAKQNP